MKKWVAAVAAVAILTAPAFAQGRGKGGRRAGGEQQTEEQKKKNAEAYRAALDRIPNKTSADPWGGMR
jgi:hypothetical protein